MEGTATPPPYSYYAWLQAEYLRKRDKLVAALRDAGMKPIVPEGSFFIMADTSCVRPHWGSRWGSHRTLRPPPRARF